MEHDEQIVLQRIQNGEVSAFRELVERYKQKVYYLALDFTGNHHDAEDMSQEVFMKVFSSIREFRGDAKIGSWLYRITVNTCLDKLRRKPLHLVELNEQIAEDFHSNTDPEREVSSKRTRAMIDSALLRLPPRQRSIFILRHYNDMMLKEIGEVLGISEGTVKAQLFRAVKKLQKELAVFRKPGRGGSNG